MKTERAIPVTIKIIDYGLYQLLDTSQRNFQADSTAGYASIIRTQLLKNTTVVPMKKQQVFGFNYRIEDNNVDEEWVPVTVRIRHPETKNYLGYSGTGFSKQSFARRKEDGGYHNGAYYVLSEDYELVPGEWELTVVYQGELSVSTVFTVR